MNTRVRTALQTMKPTPKHDKVSSFPPSVAFPSEKVEKEKKTEAQGRSRFSRIQSRRERKLALQQDVEKLKKKLRHEENVHRALERAFTRPLGALPRLPPYLPSHTLELLAEVAVLEEEVARLEEQVVSFRQGLYQEAVYILSSKNERNQSDPCPPSSSSQNFKTAADPSPSMRWPSDVDPNEPSPKRFANGTRPPKMANEEDRRRKENQLNANTTAKNTKQSPAKRVPRTKSFQGSSDEVLAWEEASGPNKLSEDILNCLLSIFSQMSSQKNPTAELAAAVAVPSGEGDPYGSCSEFGRRGIGRYKHFVSVEPNPIDPNLTAASSSFLSRRLKLLLRKLAIVDLSGLTHQQNLALWINIYNSCMMNVSFFRASQVEKQLGNSKERLLTGSSRHLGLDDDE
ncbi:uncharacterized protein M6B38_137335 [Iris pallida]|uniref:Ternary complex factor MIP1 leucine-zipper domain-containing protein n=1 Tax=Iris pallida TaxID=29817 RepID=A0AAX6FEG1_IRIPA|nr:uncharacterized protein M6B38_137335 [Iris pallida]